MRARLNFESESKTNERNFVNETVRTGQKTCLFDLMLYVPVNCYGYVGTFPLCYGTCIQNKVVMASKK